MCGALVMAVMVFAAVCAHDLGVYLYESSQSSKFTQATTPGRTSLNNGYSVGTTMLRGLEIYDVREFGYQMCDPGEYADFTSLNGEMVCKKPESGLGTSTNPLTISSSGAIYDSAAYTRNVTTQGDLNVTGNLTVSGNLVVKGKTEFSNGICFSW